jgi:hypothetical protein
MVGFLFWVGLIVTYFAVQARLQRKADRKAEFVELYRRKKEAYLWDYGIEAAEKAIKAKAIEHDSWRNNIKFELVNWTAFAVGAMALLLVIVFWMGEDPTHTFGQLWKNFEGAWPYFIGAVFLYVLYKELKRLDRADSEIRWLDATLEKLKHYTDRKDSDLSDRLEVVERAIASTAP